MNRNIQKLTEIASKDERIIIGLMSGTSLDGLDVAICKIKKNGFDTEVTVQHFETVEYDSPFRNKLKETCFKENISLKNLTLLNKLIGECHAEIIKDLLKKWNISNANIDLIASHGQTVYHTPSHPDMESGHGSATLQIGDGDQIAVQTGITTISDFRQKHIAAGGEGAPLAVYGDLLLFGEKENNIVLLNIGGIANFTFIPAGVSGKIISSDIGPGNTLMNQWTVHNFSDQFYDKDALIAMNGNVSKPLLDALQKHSFFNIPFPKTTGPELFNLEFLNTAIKHSGINDLNAGDIMATLNKFTADIICNSLQPYAKNNNTKLYISGGGTHNPLLMQYLIENLNHFIITDINTKGISPDAKEAVLFAILANECVAGNPDTFKNISDLIPAVSMGKISFPV